jgi:hypothetical protein
VALLLVVLQMVVLLLGVLLLVRLVVLQMVLLAVLRKYTSLIQVFLLLVVLSIQMGCVLFYPCFLHLADLVGLVLLPDIVPCRQHLHDR